MRRGKSKQRDENAGGAVGQEVPVRRWGIGGWKRCKEQLETKGTCAQIWDFAWADATRSQAVNRIARGFSRPRRECKKETHIHTAAT